MTDFLEIIFVFTAGFAAAGALALLPSVAALVYFALKKEFSVHKMFFLFFVSSVQFLASFLLGSISANVLHNIFNLRMCDNAAAIPIIFAFILISIGKYFLFRFLFKDKSKITFPLFIIADILLVVFISLPIIYFLPDLFECSCSGLMCGVKQMR